MSLAAKAGGCIMSILTIVFAIQIPIAFRGWNLIALLLVSGLIGIFTYASILNVIR